jgi:hypothetical protein
MFVRLFLLFWKAIIRLHDEIYWINCFSTSKICFKVGFFFLSIYYLWEGIYMKQFLTIMIV